MKTLEEYTFDFIKNTPESVARILDMEATAKNFYNEYRKETEVIERMKNIECTEAFYIKPAGTTSLINELRGIVNNIFNMSAPIDIIEASRGVISYFRLLPE